MAVAGESVTNNVTARFGDTGPGPEADLFALGACDQYRLPQGGVLLRSRRGGGQAVLAPDAAGLLGRCDRFRTRDGHVDALVAQLPAMRGRESHVASMLDAAIAQGLFVSGRDCLRRLQAAPAGLATQAPVASILTSDRPQALRRLLASVANHCRPDSACRLLVIDDSRDGACQRDNRALVDEWAPQVPFPLHYVGVERQSELLRGIAQLVPGCDAALDFLVGEERWRHHPRYGRSRNLALLLSVGQRLLQLDDDILCAAYRPPFAAAGVGLRRSPRQADFIPANEEWFGGFDPMDGADPLALHGACLGLPLPAAVAAAGESLSLDALREALADDVTVLDATTPVLSTACGTLGDPGSTSNGWLLDLDEASLARLYSDPAKLESALSERRGWSVRERLHVQPAFAMSQLTGLDHRQLLPAYFPAFRGEDGLYGSLLSCLYPQARCLDLPWAVAHLPLPERRWATPGLAAAIGIFLPSAARSPFADLSRCRSEEPRVRMEWMAGEFERLADMPAASLQRHLRREWLGRTVARQRRVRELLRRAAGAPPRWREVLADAAGMLDRQLAAGPGREPIGAEPAGLPGPELWQFWQSSWRSFGLALSYWPEICRAASQVTAGWYE